MPKLIELPTFSDQRGDLTVLEKQLPFEIRRVFFIHNVKSLRGGHGHRKTQMALMSLSGSVTIRGQSPQEDFSIALNHPSQCLILSPEDWHEMDGFSEHTTLLVLASHEYDKEDYFFERYR